MTTIPTATSTDASTLRQAHYSSGLDDKTKFMNNVNTHRGHNIIINEETAYVVNLEKKTFDIKWSEWAEHGEMWCDECHKEIEEYDGEFFDEITSFIENEDWRKQREERVMNVGKNVLLLLFAVATVVHIF